MAAEEELHRAAPSTLQSQVMDEPTDEVRLDLDREVGRLTSRSGGQGRRKVEANQRSEGGQSKSDRGRMGKRERESQVEQRGCRGEAGEQKGSAASQNAEKR